MKKKEYRILIFTVLLLIIAATCLLRALVTIEDRSLERKTKSYETETVNLTPDGTALKQLIKEISSVYSGNLTVTESADREKEERLAAELQSFLDLIGAGKTEIRIEKISASLVFAPSLDYQSLYHFWDCAAYTDEGGLFHVLIDDVTGKILSFVCPNYYVNVYTEKEIDDFSGKMEDYYGFSLDDVVISYPYKKKYFCFNYEIKDSEDLKNILYDNQIK